MDFKEFRWRQVGKAEPYCPSCRQKENTGPGVRDTRYEIMMRGGPRAFQGRRKSLRDAPGKGWDARTPEDKDSFRSYSINIFVI